LRHKGMMDLQHVRTRRISSTACMLCVCRLKKKYVQYTPFLLNTSFFLNIVTKTAKNSYCNQNVFGRKMSASRHKRFYKAKFNSHYLWCGSSEPSNSESQSHEFDSLCACNASITREILCIKIA